MRILAVILLFGLASEGWAETGISGMLACTPKDSQQKPVIYAFDGQYLLRDSDSSAPFKKVVSLYDDLDLYFAFIPTKKTLENHEGLVRQYKNYQSKKKEISAEVARFKSLHCPKVNKADFSAPFYKKFEGKKSDVGIPKNFHCSSKIEDEFQTEAPKVKIEEFLQVKLTIDFREMVVREEIFTPSKDIVSIEHPTVQYFLSAKEFDHRFSGTEYQCQSLGIAVPKIDTSQSLTPIGKDL